MEDLIVLGAVLALFCFALLAMDWVIEVALPWLAGLAQAMRADLHAYRGQR